MLGELVQTTARKWLTHPPTRCPNGHTLGSAEVLVGHRSVLVTAAGTPHGVAAHAMRRRCACRDSSRRYFLRCAARLWIQTSPPTGWTLVLLPSKPAHRLRTGVSVRFGHWLRLRGTSLPQKNRQPHYRRDRDELALPVLHRLEPELRSRHIAPHRNRRLAVLPAAPH